MLLSLTRCLIFLVLVVCCDLDLADTMASRSVSIVWIIPRTSSRRMDLFVVPTVGFGLLYGFVIVRLGRRDLVWINVTANPTAEWLARQITEAFPWDEAPRYLIRDRDRIYSSVFTRRLRAMGIR